MHILFNDASVGIKIEICLLCKQHNWVFFILSISTFEKDGATFIQHCGGGQSSALVLYLCITNVRLSTVF